MVCALIMGDAFRRVVARTLAQQVGAFQWGISSSMRASGVCAQYEAAQVGCETFSVGGGGSATGTRIKGQLCWDPAEQAALVLEEVLCCIVSV